MIEFDGFDWDDGNVEKCQKHGVSLAEIESIFSHSPLTSEDGAHSIQEARFYAVGRTQEDRAVLIVYTWRNRAGQSLIRPISARYMHAKEVASHEQEAPADTDK